MTQFQILKTKLLDMFLNSNILTFHINSKFKIRNSKLKGNSGFIALMSAIIISLVLVGLSLAVSSRSLFARFDILDHELKQESFHLAESCSQMALLKISGDYSYTPSPSGEIISVGPDQCTIISVIYGVEDSTTHIKTATITAQAENNSVWSTVTMQASIHNPLFAYLPNQKNITIDSIREQ